MADSNDYWQSVVDALRDCDFRFRIKWSRNETMTDWQRWVICPVPGYLETGSLGPVPVREVQWLDVSRLDHQGSDKSEYIVAALSSIGATYSETTDSIKISPSAA